MMFGGKGYSATNQTDTFALSNDLQLIFNLVTGGNTSNKMLYMDCSSEIMFTNDKRSLVKFAIYDIVARRDSTVGPPTDAFSDGLTDTQSSAGQTSFSRIGALPFSSPRFTQYFKVLKVSHGMLTEGQTHCHRVNYKINKVINGEVVSNTEKNLKGITCFSMIVFYGQPITATNSTIVTASSCELNVYFKRSYGYKWIDDANNTNTNSNNFPTTVAEALMDIATGSVLANNDV